MRKGILWGAAAAAPAWVVLASPMASPPSEVRFETQIWPNLKARCASCHSGSNPAAGLDLTSKAGIEKGGISGRLVKPGDPEGSVLYQRLTGANGLTQMPMGFAPLTPDELKTVRDWILQGAKLAKGEWKHWAYVAPVRPKVPIVKDGNWARNPIDAFVLAKMQAAGLKPAPTAGKEQLLRRVTLDLIGVPPTVAEIDAFLNDKSPNAYEKVVDRLLSSPHYGERQAREWLDLARYADTNGYEKDGSRVAWPYRDWVIRAYNANMPYDQFTIEQLAGDLLPHPTLSQLIATGFNRNTMKNEEGGVDQEEALFEVEIDRVVTSSTTWLGITMGCARCHDHKYDPFTMKDFYSMMAFFAHPDFAKLGDASVSEQKYTEPSIQMPTAAQLQQKQQLEARMRSVQAAIQSKIQQLQPAQARWEAAAKSGIKWMPVVPIEMRSKAGAKFQLQKDGSIVVSGTNPDRDDYTIRFRLPTKSATALCIETVPDKAFVNGGPGRSDSGNIVLSKARVRFGGVECAVRASAADYIQQGYSLAGVTDDDPETGWAFYPEVAKPHRLILECKPAAQATSNPNAELILEFESVWKQHNLGHFRILATSDELPRADIVPPDVRAILAKPSRTDAEAARIREYYAGIAPALDDLKDELANLQQKTKQLNAAIPTTLVMRDDPNVKQLTANVHTRGEFLSKAETVVANVPAALNPMPANAPRNRLGLAKWLVSKDNPLTARVEVNRMWEMFFGRGIVETTENLGVQCSPPSHPELLDWLAVEFMQNGWNRKAIQKLIVMSATYRQDSKPSPQALKTDPENIYLSHAPRLRMEAEMVRDAVLKASGLLSEKMFGPSVFPYQPEGVWDSPFSGEKWMTSKGEDLYRRSIYTFIKRTAPYPMFTTFDAGSRESCIVRRVRTNTPLQSLALLNDQGLFAAARALGEKMRTLSAKSDQERITYGFRACTSRKPNAAERKRIADYLALMKKQYQAHPWDAKKLGGDANCAAWTMVGNLLLNLDETITKG